MAGAAQPTQLVLAITTIVLSWAFIHTIFALHYAHEFYDDEGGGGLTFPGPATTSPTTGTSCIFPSSSA